ncbi:MAG: DUF3048 domain-containing protein [Acidimicrobiia bacterium]
MKTRTVLALVFVALAACGGGGDEETASTTTTEAGTTTLPPPAPDTAPLTGLPADPARATRPVLVVKLDNAPLGRPQAGINEADIVLEEGVEGGITRFAAVYHSTDAPTIGPVRSARSTDILFATQLGKPLFAYSGANAVFADLIRSSPLVDVGVGKIPDIYRREKGRPSLYNLFSATDAMVTRAPAGATPPAPLFAYRAVGEPAPAGDPAPVVQALWKDKVRTEVVYEWDPTAKGFARTQNGTPHVDAAGKRATPENVVLQVVPYKNTGLVDRSGAAVPEAELVGEGELMVLTDGKVIRGRWNRPDASAVTSYTDASGAVIKLTPGRTWIELVPPGNLTTR